jgi:dihydrofolate synthase/folylpolyglutamate synthase
MELRTLHEAESYLSGFINLERVASFPYTKLGLARIDALLGALGHPERGLRCVHIAGSKGKGTVAYATEALLRAVGYRVGTFTSPHLETWLERYRIDGQIVTAEQLLEGLAEIVPAAEKLSRDPDLRPSFFDVSTALALVLFRRANVAVGVIEVGLGGRLDSTNRVEAAVSVITSIQLEHTDKLGDTHEQIATEKAGILRTGAPALHGPLSLEALAAVMAKAVAEDVEIEEVSAECLAHDADGVSARMMDGREIRVGVCGRHQVHNLALAVRAAERIAGRSLAADELAVLEKLSLPARFEWAGDVLIDCAHTPDAVRALRLALEELYPKRPWVVVLAISRDKDAAAMLAELAPHARVCITTAPEPLRSLAAEELEALAWACGIERAVACSDPALAVARAREAATAGELIIVTGSSYLAGAARRALRQGPGVGVA